MVWHALATYETNGVSTLALVLEDKAFDLASLPAEHSSQPLAAAMSRGLLAEFGNWPAIAADLARIAEQVDAKLLKLSPIGEQWRLMQPFTPHRIFAAASNYMEHANEMGTVLAAKAESAPFIFMKASTSVIGPGSAIILPPIARQVDWEVELAAIVGRGGRNIPVEKALDHVAAYTIMNDISARDMTRRDDYPFKFDWFRGKSFDTFGPLGPWLVPAAIIGDPQKLGLRLEVNGGTMQDDNRHP